MKKIKSVAAVMAVMMALAGCAGSAEKSTTEEKNSKEDGYKFGFTEWASGSFF